MSWQQFESYHYKSDHKRSWGYTSSRHSNKDQQDGWESKKYKSQSQHNQRGERDYNDQQSYNGDYNPCYDKPRGSPSYYSNKPQRKENPSDVWNNKDKEMWVNNDYKQSNWKERHGHYGEDNSDEEVERQVRLVANDDQEERDFRAKNHSPISFVSSVKTIANEKYHKKEKVEIIRKSRVEKITSFTRQSSDEGNAIPTITNYSVNEAPKNSKQKNFKSINIFNSTDYDHKSSDTQYGNRNDSANNDTSSTSSHSKSVESNEKNNFSVKSLRPHTSKELMEIKNTLVQSQDRDKEGNDPGHSNSQSSNKPIKLLTSDQKSMSEVVFVEDCKTIANVGQMIMNDIDDNSVNDQILRAMKNVIDKLAIGHIQNILKE